MLTFFIIDLFGVTALIAWLVFNLAIYALPMIVAVITAQALHRAGLEWIMAVPAGLLAGVVTFALGQISLALIKSTWARLVIIAAFVAPSAITGFYAAYGLAGTVSHAPLTCSAFGALGAIIVGVTAFARLITPPPALAEASRPNPAG
jgi:hypothetical protein